MAGVQVGGPRPTCFTDYRTGKQTGDCSSSAPPPSAAPPPAAAPPPQAAAPAPSPITYNFPQPPPINVPSPTTPIEAPAPQQQQPQSIVSLGNQMKQPLDAINEDAMPSLRDNLGRRTPPSMSALLAQMARVY